MIPGLDPLCVDPLCVLPAVYDRSVANPVGLLMADPDAELVFVLVATPASIDADPYGLPYPLGTVPLCALSAADADTDADTVYISDNGFTTGSDDNPADTVFAPRLTQPYNFETSIPFDGSVAGAEAFGAISIANPDGAMDWILRRTWSGRRVEIRVGGTFNVGRANQRVLRFSEFGTLFVGIADGAFAEDETSITIPLRDPMGRLQVAAQQTLYAGTGGVEGGADVAGKPKPLAYGQVRNAAAVLIDSASLIYQVHDSAIHGVDAVRDNGVALTSSSDYASYAALAAATVSTGHYATALAVGMIRLGAQPSGQVTVDLKGDAVSGYVDSAGRIMRRLSVTRGTQPLADPVEIDAVAFAVLEDAASQTVGFFTGTDSWTVADMLAQLGGAIGATPTFDRSGKLTATILAEPGTPVAVHTDATMVDGQKDNQPPEPAWRVTLGYRRNWSPQAKDGLATSLTDAQRDEYANSERSVVTSASGVLARYRSAVDLSISTVLDDVVAAQAESDRRSALFRKPRRLLKREVARPLFQARLGETRTIEESRYGLDSGGDFVVVGIAEDAAQRVVTLTLWG